VVAIDIPPAVPRRLYRYRIRFFPLKKEAKKKGTLYTQPAQRIQRISESRKLKGIHVGPNSLAEYASGPK
jgi:hypothetical protein